MRTSFVATGLLSALILCVGAGQPTTRKAAECTLIVTSDGKPMAKVPVQVRGVDIQVLGKDRSTALGGHGRPLAGVLAPVFRGMTDEKGMFEIPKIKAGQYMYEAGHPEQMGYAEGGFDLAEKQKPFKVEVRLAPPMK